MTTIQSFVTRLAKINVHVALWGNLPWVYLDKVNGKKVHGKFMGDHGFTAFFKATGLGEKDHISNIPTVFKKIRETLNQES